MDDFMYQPILTCDVCLRSEIEPILDPLNIVYDPVEKLWICEDCREKNLQNETLKRKPDKANVYFEV